MGLLAPTPVTAASSAPRDITLARLAYWRDRLMEHDRYLSNRILKRDEIIANLDRYLDRLAELVPALRLCHLPADMTVWGHCEWCGEDVSGSEPSLCAGCSHCER